MPTRKEGLEPQHVLQVRKFPATSLAGLSPDIGPRARFAELKKDPQLLGLVLVRLGDGDSISQICSAWGIPRRAFRAWLACEGCRLMLRVVHDSRDAGAVLI